MLFPVSLLPTQLSRYAPGRNCNSLCRMCQQFNNYIVKFPPTANYQQRVLVLASIIHIDYEHFEKKGGDQG